MAIRAWIVGLLVAALACAQETDTPPEPLARMNVLDPTAALPYVLNHAMGMAKTPACREEFARLGVDIVAELASGEWTIVWVGPISGEDWRGRVVAIASCSGYKTVGLTPSALVSGPVQAAATILHEMAHRVGCDLPKKQRPTESKVEKISVLCRDSYIDSRSPS